MGGLVLDRSGNLYGTLQGDFGLDANGVFELSASSDGWKNTVLYTGYAGPGVVSDPLANLYGSIGPGDCSGAGAVGELSPSSGGWNCSHLYSFCSTYGCPDGYLLNVPPTWDHAATREIAGAGASSTIVQRAGRDYFHSQSPFAD